MELKELMKTKYNRSYDEIHFVKRANPKYNQCQKTTWGDGYQESSYNDDVLISQDKSTFPS